MNANKMFEAAKAAAAAEEAAAEAAEAAKRAAAIPTGYTEYHVVSEYRGSHPEYCGEFDEVFFAVPAGTPCYTKGWYHMTNSRGNWSEKFAAMPGSVVWDGDAWVSPSFK